jgi:Big-like domain-containing protein/WD40 repeat protein
MRVQVVEGMRNRSAASQRLRLADVGLMVAGLALGCTDTPTDTATFTVGGTVSGLMGTGLVLGNNGGDELPVSANGLVTFATPLASGAAYGVTVLTQPSSPAQTCGVLHGSGRVSHANITTIEIDCSSNSYRVGGTVSGLIGTGLMVSNNGGDNLSVSADGPITFLTQLASGATYSVSVVNQPTNPDQLCLVASGSGAVVDADVTTVAVTCFLAGPASPILVSSLVPDLPASSSVVGTARRDVTVVYVSLRPETIPDGLTATVSDVQTGSSVTTSMVDGGFDPVAITAIVGDTLTVAVALNGGRSPLLYQHVVAVVERPTVVRTNPPAHKRDVPLNGLIVIVFSEPIDPTTLTGATLQLKQGTTLVPGQLVFADTAHLSARFTPTALLAGGSDYVLTVTQGIRGVSGQSLDSAITVPFTTGTTLPAPGQIIFADTAGANGQTIYAIQPDGNGRRMLIAGSGEAPGLFPLFPWDRLAWSPDAAHFVFQQFGGLWRANADGSAVALLQGPDPGFPDQDNGAPSWSPDGNWISGANFVWYTADQFTGIYLTRADGTGTVIRLTTGYDWWPAWSPDGRQIAFARFYRSYFLNPGTNAGSDIWVMRLDGSRQRSLTTTGWPVSGLSWSPDGSRIAFSADSAGCQAIWIMNADGSGMTRLTPCDAIQRNPSWSPDATTLVFERDRDIYTIKADGSGLTRLTFDANSVCPAWSQ